MSCGVVPIVSRIAAHEDIIVHGKNGFLFSGTKELTKLLMRIDLMDQESYDSLAINAMKTADALRVSGQQKFISHFSKYE
jgi:hypothetical protein